MPASRVALALSRVLACNGRARGDGRRQCERMRRWEGAVRKNGRGRGGWVGLGVGVGVEEREREGGR
eukprot:4603730-Pleurochrysis_carterae.AAC.1